MIDEKSVVYLIVLFAMLMLPHQVSGQSGAPEMQLRRSVPPDTESMVSSASLWLNREGQCRTNRVPALELLTVPQHGTVRFATVDAGVPKGSGCANSVGGEGVFYRPTPGFVAQDQFTYNYPADPMAFDVLGPLEGRGS
jgi:hypothetical protein